MIAITNTENLRQLDFLLTVEQIFDCRIDTGICIK